MKIHLAGIMGKKDRENVDKTGYKNILLSYYFTNQRNLFTNKFKSFLIDKNIILDSGAYSAFTRKENINISEYVDFIKQIKLKHYITLDVIDNPISTKLNTEYMESKGLNPIPVYHYNTNSLDLLKYYCDNYNYVCIGGTVPLRPKDKLAYSIIRILDKCNTKDCRIHLLGYNSIKGLFILKNHIYSVDSTTWTIAAGFGEVLYGLGKRSKIFSHLEKKKRVEMNINYMKKIQRILGDK